MILLAIAGGLAVLWLYQRRSQQSGAAQPGATSMPSQVAPNRIPSQPQNSIVNPPVAPVAVTPTISNYGPPVMASGQPATTTTFLAPSFVAPSNTRAADAAAGLSVRQNLGLAVSIEQAQGTYQGYGVPLSGPGLFSPLPFDDSGYIIDSGSIGFSGGPLAG